MNYGGGYETSYTTYGAGGGSGGGGFMPGEGSQQSPSGRREYSQDSLRPVTIKQILSAQIDPTLDKDSCKIDGSPATQLTLVGQIRNISVQTTQIVYRVDDGTGSIEVRHWQDPHEEERPYKQKLVEGAYCRAWGKLKEFGDSKKRSVAVTIIRPIEDMNEVSYHLLEATAVHLHYTRGPIDSLNAGGSGAANGAGQQQAGDNVQGGYDAGPTGTVARKVYNMLREIPQGNEGVHQQEIAARLGIDTAEVAKAGDDLLANGYIYTTVDDQTWAVLEAE